MATWNTEPITEIDCDPITGEPTTTTYAPGTILEGEAHTVQSLADLPIFGWAWREDGAALAR
jgi:hypothetical protein